MTLRSVIFLTNLFAVCGASERRQKYGNQIFRAAPSSGRVAIPLNPVADQVEGCTAYRRLEQIPECPESVCLVTPPSVTLSFVQEAIELGVQIPLGAIWIATFRSWATCTGCWDQRDR